MPEHDPAATLAVDGPDSCCWAATGWEDAGESSVVSADTHSRAQAMESYSHNGFDFTEIGAWKRYIRPLTVQDQWDYTREPTDPATPPAGWSYEAHCWEFVPRGTSGAWAVWVCGPRSLGAPSKPLPETGTQS